MGIDSEEPTPLGPSLSKGQVEAFQRAEPKTLGAVQIIIAVLTLCLSVTLLHQEIHFSGDVKVLCVVVGQLILSGSVLVHAGRKPSVFWLKSILVLHLVSAAFATAALGLLSKHLPYQQDAYHCEHCYRLQNAAVKLIDGITGTLVLFLVLELVICIVAMLFGLNALANGSFQLAVSSLTVPTHQSPAVAASAAASAAAAATAASAASAASAAIPIPDPTEAVVEEAAVPDEPQVIVSSPRTQTPETPSIMIDEPQVAPAEMDSETES